MLACAESDSAREVNYFAYTACIACLSGAQVSQIHGVQYVVVTQIRKKWFKYQSAIFKLALEYPNTIYLTEKISY